MREIKFRARHRETGEWYYGSSLITDINQGDDYNLTLSLFWLQVEKGWLDSKTVGQYTGLKDKNGKEYYSEDIFQKDNYKFIIRWHDDRAGWWLYWSDNSPSQSFSKLLAESGFNIGNIYEEVKDGS